MQSRAFLFDELIPRYLSVKDCDNIKAFKFKGEDRSLLYNYILSPLSESIVQRIPKWVHPNVLTLCGLLCNAVSHLVVLCYSPSLTEPCPSCVWALTGVMVLLYQLFDNLDGKQARRLGLSSALGLIVDHGCDGINVVMSTSSAGALFQYGAGLRTLTTLFMATSQFYFAAWDEYYRGEFILPYVNGPNEGVMILAIVYFASAIMPDYSVFWHTRQTLPFFGGSFERCDIALVLCSASAVPVVLTHVYGVWYHSSCQSKQSPVVGHAIATVAPYCLGVGLACCWIAITEIMSIHPRLTIWFIGLLFSYTVTQIQVAHVCDSPLQPYRWPCIASVMVLLCNYLLGAITGEPPIDEGKALQFATYFLLVAWVFMATAVLRDIANALDVPVWTVPVKVQSNRKKLASD